MKTFENNKQAANPQADGTDTPEKKVNPRKEELKALSQGLGILVKEGVYNTINEALLDIHYRNNGHEVFNTFQEWKTKGFSVKKGEKAFALWSSPQKGKSKVKLPQELNPEGEDEGYNFFALCYVFSNLQVEPTQAKTPNAL